MATIDLNNLIRPKLINSNTTLINKQAQKPTPVYVDLHLDLQSDQNIGLGNNPANSNDILVDTDLEAVKNSIRNIFTTIPGQKVLNPTFGASLDQFLFEPVTELGANVIGNTIRDAINEYEPRVTLLGVYVEMNPQSTSQIGYNGNSYSLINPNSNQNIGEGYAVTISYQFKEIPIKQNVTLFAQLGGQIII
jgi:phage baseplate assembly protein W